MYTYFGIDKSKPPMCQLLVSGVWPTEGILLSWPNREVEFVFFYIYLKKANPKRRQNSQETVNFIKIELIAEIVNLENAMVAFQT